MSKEINKAVYVGLSLIIAGGLAYGVGKFSYPQKPKEIVSKQEIDLEFTCNNIDDHERLFTIDGKTYSFMPCAPGGPKIFDSCQSYWDYVDSIVGKKPKK